MNDRWKLFAEEYVKDFNGAKAARRAGYTSKSARKIAWSIMQNEEVQQYIQTLTKRVAAKNEVEVNDLVAELKKMAFVDIGKIFDANNELLPIHEIDEDTRRAISEFYVKEMEGKYGKSVDKRAKMHSKLEAIEKLMRFAGAYEADNKQKGHEMQGHSTDELRAELEAIRKRRKLTEEEE